MRSKELTEDKPFLAPIEDPEDKGMKQMYAFMLQQFGKVFTPLKVQLSRLPPSFSEFYMKINELDGELEVTKETALLIREQVARINVCLFCIDASRWAVINSSMNEAKFDALEQYRTSSLFTEAERAALDYVTELTRDKKVNPKTFAQMAKHYSEREICEIVYLVASEHLYNMTNIGLNIHSDMLCDIARRKQN